MTQQSTSLASQSQEQMQLDL